MELNEFIMRCIWVSFIYFFHLSPHVPSTSQHKVTPSPRNLTFLTTSVTSAGWLALTRWTLPHTEFLTRVYLGRKRKNKTRGSPWLDKVSNTRLTDFGGSHCLGLSGRCAPQGAAVCRRALRKTQLNPGRQTIVSRWQDTSLQWALRHVSVCSLLTALSSWSEKGKKKKKRYRWPLGSHVPLGWRTIPPLRHSRLLSAAAVELSLSFKKQNETKQNKTKKAQTVAPWGRSCCCCCCCKLFGEFPRCAPKVWSAWTGKREREVGRSE